MFRTEDFDSNAVARFPVKFRTVYAELGEADGVSPKEIFSSGSFYPGSKIRKIYAKNVSTTEPAILELKIGETAASFFNFELDPGETKELISLLGYELELEIDKSVFISSEEISERVSITIFAVDF